VAAAVLLTVIKETHFIEVNAIAATDNINNTKHINMYS
jgi:hypothetical protein